VVDVNALGFDAEDVEGVALNRQVLLVGRDTGVADSEFAHPSIIPG